MDYEVLAYIGAFSVLLPILICIIKIKALNRTLWALLFYLVLSIVANKLCLILRPNQANVNVVLNCFTVFECLIFYFIYYTEFNHPNIKKILLVSSCVFVVIVIINFSKNLNKEDNLISTIEAASMIIISGLYFVKLLVDPPDTKLTKYYFFWINFALLIYFCASLLLFMNTDFLQVCKPETAMRLWSIHELAGITSNILLSIGIWNMRRKPL